MASNQDNKRLLRSLALAGITSAILFYIGNRYGELLAMDGRMFLNCYLDVLISLPAALAAEPLRISLGTTPLLIGGGCFLAVWLAWLALLPYMGTYRTGEESGSAKWGTLKEGMRFLDKKEPDNNLLFTEHFGLAMKRKKFNLDLDRNLNVLVIGGSGSGKTRYYVKPNLMQLNASYFVTDPKGTLLPETGHLFEDAGYRIKCFDTINFENSMHYNPLHYVKSNADILTFVNIFMTNTNGEGKSGNDPFWENSERLLYIALIAFLRDWCHPRHYSIDGLLTLFSLAEASENDESFQSPLDLMFLQIETGKKYVKADSGASTIDARAANTRTAVAKQGKSRYVEVPSDYKRRGDGVEPAKVGGLSPSQDYALSNYKAFKTAAGKTLKSIIISCNARLSRLAITQVRELLKYDEMELDKMGDAVGEDGAPLPKTVLFSILSDTDESFSFLHAIMMSQLLDQLCRRALEKHGGRLPVPVHMIFDEFANIGTVAAMDTSIAVTRSRNIGITIIVQSSSQLVKRYDKAAKIIMDCCDTTLFLGGKSSETNEEIAKMVGKQTIRQMTYGQSAGQSSSASKNMQIGARDLIDAAEIGKMPRRKAIVLIAGTDPLMDDKYPLEKHPRYAYIDPGHRGALYDEPFDFAEYRRRTARRVS